MISRSFLTTHLRTNSNFQYVGLNDQIYYSTSSVVWTALLPTRPGITIPWLQPNISLNLQPITFALKSSSQGFSQSWCQGESFPVNARVTDVLGLEQMCHTAVISTEYIIRHVQELQSPANDPCVVTQLGHRQPVPTGPWMPLARSLNIITNFSLCFSYSEQTFCCW